MPRDLTDDLAAIYEGKSLQPVLFVEIQFVSGWVRMWSGIGSISWNGKTWLGIGLPNGEILGGLTLLTETSDVQAQGIALSLSGIPSSAVQQVLNETRQAFTANMYLGAIDPSTMAIIADPYLAWSGTTDVATINVTGETCTVTITVENYLLDLQRLRRWLYTHEDQQILSPGDTGFRFVPQLQNTTIWWGTVTPSIVTLVNPTGSGIRTG
jgi:hypothetical protein